MRRAFQLAGALALLGTCLAAAALPQAGAVGPSLQLTVSPPQATGTPTASGPGTANFTATVDLFSNPVGRATIALTMDSDHGWTVTPGQVAIPVTAPGRYSANFTVEVPVDSVAGAPDAILVTAAYQVGGVSTYTEQTTVHAEAGAYYALAVRQASVPPVMEPGKNYAVSFEVKNEGNAPGAFVFSIADPAVMDRLRSQVDLPDSPSIAGQNQSTVEVLIVPGGNTPAGKYDVPLRIEVRDRMGTIQAVTNVTMSIEVTNSPIYQGWLPNWNLRTPYTLGAFAFILLMIWFGFQVLFAVLRSRKHKSGIFAELGTGLRESRLARLLGALTGRLLRRPSRPKRVKAPLTPAEVKGRANVRVTRPPSR